MTDGMVFYLQDVSGGKPLTTENTLGIVIAHLQPQLASFSASPNPAQAIQTGNGMLLGETTLTWDAPTAQGIQIRLGSPSGPLFVESGPSGTATTGEWVTDGMVFFLQDITGGKSLTQENTLATVAVHLQE